MRAFPSLSPNSLGEGEKLQVASLLPPRLGWEPELVGLGAKARHFPGVSKMGWERMRAALRFSVLRLVLLSPSPARVLQKRRWLLPW